MAFEIYRTQRTISGQSANALMPRDYNLGGQALGTAIAGFGAALGKEGYRLDLIEADTQLTEAKAAFRQEHNRFMLSLDSMEPSEYYEAYEQSLKKRSGLTPKNKRAARQFNIWSTAVEPYFYNDVSQAWQSRLKDDYRAEGYQRRQDYVETGIGADYFDHLIKGTKLGAYKAEEAEKYRQYAVEERQRYAKTQKALRDEEVKEQLELLREEDRDKIFGMIRRGEPITSVNEASHLDEKEQWQMYEYERLAIERRQKGEGIITDISKKQDLLDYASLISENKITEQEVKNRAYEGRYGKTPWLDDKAYDEVRDAIRAAVEDKIPYTKSHIEDVIGALTTGAPVTIYGFPLKSIRTRKDAFEYATNELSRFVTRIPDVLATINALYPPTGNRVPFSEALLKVEEPAPVEKTNGNPAFDFQGIQIGYYNSDGSITLNMDGARQLWEIAGRDAKEALRIIKENRYVIPIQLEMQLKEPQVEK